MSETDHLDRNLAKQNLTGELLPAAERWVTGDIVLAANGALWQRAREIHIAQGWAWSYVSENVSDIRDGAVEDSYPTRPLRLLVRGGQPVGNVTD